MPNRNCPLPQPRQQPQFIKSAALDDVLVYFRILPPEIEVR